MALRFRMAMLLLALLVAGGVPSYGSPVSGARIEAWLDSAIAEAAKPCFFRDIAVTCEMELHWTLPPAEIERLRPLVAQSPQSSDAREVAAADRLVANGPRRQTIEFRVRSEGEWRVNTSLGASGAYRDVVVRPTLAWSLTPDWLVLVDPRKGWPAGSELESEQWSFRNCTDVLIHADLPKLTQRLKMSRGPVRVDGDLWSCDFSIPGVMTRRCEGRWDDGAGRGFVDRIIVVASKETPLQAGSVTSFGEWRRDDILGVWIAESSETRWSDGSLMLRYGYKGAVREEAGHFERCTAAPRFDGSDAIRGALTVGRVQDFRGDGLEETSFDPDGASIMRAPVSRSWASSGAARVTGWVLAGGIIVAMVGIRVSRRLRNN